jgi:hypothetical protein
MKVCLSSRDRTPAHVRACHFIANSLHTQEALREKLSHELVHTADLGDLDDGMFKFEASRQDAEKAVLEDKRQNEVNAKTLAVDPVRVVQPESELVGKEAASALVADPEACVAGAEDTTREMEAAAAEIKATAMEQKACLEAAEPCAREAEAAAADVQVTEEERVADLGGHLVEAENRTQEAHAGVANTQATADDKDLQQIRAAWEAKAAADQTVSLDVGLVVVADMERYATNMPCTSQEVVACTASATIADNQPDDPANRARLNSEEQARNAPCNS